MPTPEVTYGNTALGRADLDGDHDRLFARLAALEACGDAELDARLAEFAAEAQAHFAYEDHLMDAGDFATKDCHVQEHAAVLASLAEVQGLLAKGESAAVARRLVRELRRWLPEHIGALDHALAQWLFRRGTGGARLVLHPHRASVPVSATLA